MNVNTRKNMVYNDLSLSERAQIRHMGVQAGLKSLSDIRSFYDNAVNEYAEGGGIHISPSKRGTFTAAATKHGKSVQAFASQVLAHKENYSPAMVRKANFARNARKWKHSTGGPLYPFSFSKQPVPAVRFASGGDTKEEFIPSDTIRNKQVWVNKGTVQQRQRPGTVNLQNITDRLDPLGADTQYVWDSPDRSSYSAFRRNPDYRASQMPLIKSATSNLFNVPLAQYPEIKVSIPKTTLPPAYSLTMRRIPNGNWIRMGGENNGVAGYEILHLENSPYYGIDYQSAPGSISSGEGSIIQTDSLIKGIPIQELNQRIFDYKTRLGGNFIPSDI